MPLEGWAATLPRWWCLSCCLCFFCGLIWSLPLTVCRQVPCDYPKIGSTQACTIPGKGRPEVSYDPLRTAVKYEHSSNVSNLKLKGSLGPQVPLPVPPGQETHSAIYSSQFEQSWSRPQVKLLHLLQTYLIWTVPCGSSQARGIRLFYWRIKECR